jgi:hypothetical protein
VEDSLLQPNIQNIIEFLKSKPPQFFQFKKIRGRTTGIFKGDHIEFDYRKDLVQTILHECVHALRPELSETKVIAMERKLMKVLTGLEAAELLSIVSKKIKYTETRQSYLKRE